MKRKIILLENGVKALLQPCGTEVKNGYLIKGLLPLWSLAKINNLGLDKDILKHLKLDELNDEQLKCVWKLNEEVEGKMFLESDIICDDKTEKYIESTIKNIGYIETISGYEEELEKHYKIVNSIDNKKLYFNTSDVEIFELEKDNKKYYGYQYSLRTAIDDYVILTYIFDRLHNDINILETARVIEDIQMKIVLEKWNDYFECWECGNNVHWLDGNTDKGIVKKYQAKKERYCGC